MYLSFFKDRKKCLQAWPYATALMLAAWIIYIQHGWINIDSILYFEMARHISMGDWQSAYAVEGFSWGFYPALIALFHSITGLSIQYVANLLNVIFFMLIIKATFDLVKLAGGSRETQMCAFFLLIGAKYIVGDILPMAIRDMGYWAFMLNAITQLIRYFLVGKFKHALFWQLLGGVAMLFRIEGAIYLLCMPLIGFLFKSDAINTWQKKLAPYSLVLGCVICIYLAIAITQTSTDSLGRLNEVLSGFDDIKSNFTHQLSDRARIMGESVIGEPFKEYAWFTYLLSIFAIVSIKSLTVGGYAPLLVMMMSPKNSYRKFNPLVTIVLVYLFLLTWLVGSLIALKVNLLSTRYVGLSGFAMIVMASLPIAQFLKSKQTFKSRLLIGLVVVIVGWGLLSGTKFKNDEYYYEIDAANYVTRSLKTDEKVLYNNARLRFYAHAPYDGRIYDEWAYIHNRVEDGRFREYRFIVISMPDMTDSKDKYDYLMTHLDGYELDKVFDGFKKKKRVYVFKKIGS